MISSFFSLLNNRRAMSTSTISLIVAIMIALIVFIVFIAGLKGKFDLIGP